MDDELLYDNPDYLDEDENEIDWNEQILAREELEELEEQEDNDDTEDEDDILKKVNDSSYLTPLLTDIYIKKQLDKPEFNRDRIKFYYKKEIVYGHILCKTPSGKYVFDIIDISTGEHQTKILNGDYIDSF